jgi:hypothetical protein
MYFTCFILLHAELEAQRVEPPRTPRNPEQNLTADSTDKKQRVDLRCFIRVIRAIRGSLFSRFVLGVLAVH